MNMHYGTQIDLQSASVAADLRDGILFNTLCEKYLIYEIEIRICQLEAFVEQDYIR